MEKVLLYISKIIMTINIKIMTIRNVYKIIVTIKLKIMTIRNIYMVSTS